MEVSVLYAGFFFYVKYANTVKKSRCVFFGVVVVDGVGRNSKLCDVAYLRQNKEIDTFVDKIRKQSCVDIYLCLLCEKRAWFPSRSTTRMLSFPACM